MDALAENTKITSNFLEVSVGWLLQDGFCIKVPLCHLKWSKTRDIKGHQGIEGIWTSAAFGSS